MRLEAFGELADNVTFRETINTSSGDLNSLAAIVETFERAYDKIEYSGYELVATCQDNGCGVTYTVLSADLDRLRSALDGEAVDR